MKRIGFILKSEADSARRHAAELLPALSENGVERLSIAGDGIGDIADREVTEEEFAGAVDLAVVLGGDGTMLRANRIVADSGVPVLGINLGHLGFLAPFEPAHALATVRAALAGSLPTTRRMRLQVQLERSSGEVDTWIALNDAVLHQGGLARLLELNAYQDDGFVASYRSDGVIIATPTGSTAYSLAAGGPILMPEQQALLLTPICAHALTMRPLVFSYDSNLRIEMGSHHGDVALTVDGFWNRSITNGDRLVVTRANAPLVVFAAPGKRYFDILREKMHWGVREGRVSSKS